MVHLKHVHLISICLCVLSLMHGQSRQWDGFLPHAPCRWSLLSAALPLPRYSKGFPLENLRTYICCVFTFGMLPLSFYKGVICSSSVIIYILSHVLLYQECIITRWRRTSASWRSAWTASCRSTTLTSTSKMITSMNCKSWLQQHLLNKVMNKHNAIYLFDHFYSLQLSIWCGRATHSCCIFGR